MKQMPDSMKPLLIITMLGLCETLSSLSAEVEQGPARGFYFSANAGASWVQDLSFSGDPLGTGKLKFDPGVRLDLGGGYRFSDSLAAGIETGLVANGARTVGSDEEFNSLTLFQVPILATLKYQIPLRSRFRPYLGAGAGGVYTELDNLDVLGTVNNASDFTFGYEGFAGVLYQISPRIDLGLEYKFMGTTDHSFQHVGGTRTHSILVAFSLRF